MEELDNKTIMCSVLFLDIVGYSKKSVTGQIALKDRFNSYLSTAIQDVPITDRIILDTGDGAAINFLGDIEDALKASLILRDSLINEDPAMNHPLLVRMGINLGPVRLVRDINGQPNIVGDGINVAQRVMGFADASQVLVSRSYFDAVSRLSPQYADLFHYQGSRTDKHVREHEVYAIGYPGGKVNNPALTKQAKKAFAKAVEGTGASFRPMMLSLKWHVSSFTRQFRQAGPFKRGFYVAGIAFILLATFEFTEEQLVKSNSPIFAPKEQVTYVKKPDKITVLPSVSSPVVVQNNDTASPKSIHGETKLVVPKLAKQEELDSKKIKEEPLPSEADQKMNVVVAPAVVWELPAPVATPVIAPVVDKQETFDNTGTQITSSRDTRISVTCQEGTELFIDGTRKGKLENAPLLLPVTPGRHLVIVSNAKGMDWKIIKFETGTTVAVSPDFCKE